jgi:hypothetical protein
MAKTIRYQKMQKMEPREGVNYATTYLKQTLEQRKDLCRHIKQCITEITEAVEQDPELNDFVRQPLRGFKTTTGVNRSTADILSDMVNEAKGKQKNNLPKDFAMAPIERWNKLFEDTDYEIVLVQTFSQSPNNFSKLMEFDLDTI